MFLNAARPQRHCTTWTLTGLLQDDPAQLKSEKTVSCAMCCLSIVIGVLMTVAHCVGGHADNLTTHYFRLIHYVIWIVMLVGALVWYFLCKSHVLILIVALILGPWVPAQSWLANGCNIERTGSAFFYSFAIMALLFAAGVRRSIIAAYVAVSMFLASAFYIIHCFHVQSNGYWTEAPWCPLKSVPHSIPVQTWLMLIVVFGTQFACFHIFVTQLLKHQEVLCVSATPMLCAP